MDRHLRLLDQSIKEQEVAISCGARPGTHPTPIVLPEVIVPGVRVRQAHSPAPKDLGVDAENVMTLGILGGDEDGPESDEVVSRRGKPGKKPRGRPRKGAMVDDMVTNPSSRGRVSGGGTRSSKLTVAEPAVDEERYCYCNQISFGEVMIFLLIRDAPSLTSKMQMVACDNEDCEREWVSVVVRLQVQPTDWWFKVPFGLCGSRAAPRRRRVMVLSRLSASGQNIAAETPEETVTCTMYMSSFR